MSTSLTVRPVNIQDVPAVSEMLRTERREYHQYFIPFDFDEHTIRTLIESAKQDMYTGLWYDDILVGFFMLRGFDAGFTIPAYGVYIREAYAGKGLATLTMNLAISVCKLRGVAKLMLKVHPDNIRAKAAYENFGFTRTGLDTKNNNFIYHYDVL